MQCNQVVDKLLEGTNNLFHAISCDNSSILDLLGDNTTATMNNVILYLGIIERRITEMFNKVHWLDITRNAENIRLDEEKKPKLKVPPLAQIASTQPCAL